MCSYAMDKLREVGNKFRNPEIASAFNFWAKETERVKWAAELARQKAQQAAIAKEKRELDAQLELVCGRASHRRNAALCTRSTLPLLSPQCNELPALGVLGVLGVLGALGALSALLSALSALSALLSGPRTLMPQVRREYEVKLSNAEEQRIALLEKVAVLGGGAAEAEALMEARAAKEREERIELVRRQSLRRIMNQGISTGFGAWIELWEAKTWAMKRLREVGNKLTKTDVAYAFGE